MSVLTFICRITQVSSPNMDDPKKKSLCDPHVPMKEELLSYLAPTWLRQSRKKKLFREKDRLNSPCPPLCTIAIQEGHTIHMVKSATNRASEQAVQTVRPLNNSSNSLGGPEGFDEQVRNIFSWLCPIHHLHPTTHRQTKETKGPPRI
jgi:hypothetical protein